MKTDELVMVANGHRHFTPGITKIEGGIHICTVAAGENCCLVVYEEGSPKGKRFPFPKEQRIGDVWSMDLMGADFTGLTLSLIHI